MGGGGGGGCPLDSKRWLLGEELRESLEADVQDGNVMQKEM